MNTIPRKLAVPTNKRARKKVEKPTRQALIVLGMHRAGTSALSGVLAKLGAQAPKSLMPPTADNPRGYWESTALMKFHDRILDSAGTRWSDWDAFNPDWIESPSGDAYLPELSDLLESEYGNARLILIKDPRMCRLFPFWVKALTELGIAPKVVVPLRHPSEVTKSLQARDHLTADQAKLLWLRHLLDAEFSSRAVPRTFVRYTDLLDDWQSEVERVSAQLDIKWPRRSSSTEAEINNYLSPELRHHAVATSPPSSEAVISNWAGEAYRAVDFLIDDPQRAESLRSLDAIREEFDSTSKVYAPIVQEQRFQFEQTIENLNGVIQKLGADLTDLDAKHRMLQEENIANYRLYDDSNKALMDLRKQYQEREDTFISLVARLELVQAESADHAREMQTAKGSCADLAKKLQHLQAAHEKLKSEHEQELESSINTLNEENQQLREAARLAEKTAEQRFSEMVDRFSNELEQANEAARQAKETAELQFSETVDQLSTELEQAKEAARLAEEASQRRFAEVTGELDAEIRQLRNSLQLAGESLEERFMETSELTKVVFSLEEELAEQKSAISAERDEWNARLGASARCIEERDADISTLNGMIKAGDCRMRAYECELRVLSGLIADYNAILSALRSNRYPRLVRALLRMSGSTLELPPANDDRRDEEVLLDCHLFDHDWYLASYPDVRSQGMDPIDHYLLHGAMEGRDPCPIFNSYDYVCRYPDVATAAVNPLVHYIKYGRREGRLIFAQDPED